MGFEQHRQQFTPVGTADADMDVFEAWTTTTGSASIKIAIIDTGVDLAHSDLACQFIARVWCIREMDRLVIPLVMETNHMVLPVREFVAAVGNNNLGVAGCGLFL